MLQCCTGPRGAGIGAAAPPWQYEGEQFPHGTRAHPPNANAVGVPSQAKLRVRHQLSKPDQADRRRDRAVEELSKFDTWLNFPESGSEAL